MAKIKIMALGGLGENGKNMYCVEVDERIFILDAGLKRPDIDLYGIDSVIPDISYLLDHKDKIEGLFLSHGHVDNIGAVAYLLNNLHTRVYGSHFTISILEAMLEEQKMDKANFKLFRINANKTMKFGDVSVEFFNTSHSIPESMGIAVITKDGAIVYATDFGFVTSNQPSYRTSFDRICDLSKGKVLACLTESISAHGNTRPRNDTLLETNFNQILSTNHTRIIVGMYSNELSRIQKIVDLASAANKQIAIIGKRSQLIVKVGVESGYLKLPENTYIHLTPLKKEEIETLKDIVIIVTGYSTETYEQILKMTTSDDDIIKVTETDDVVLCCPPSAGTEKVATDVINMLCFYNINLHIFDRPILKSTHATPDDLKMLYSMLNPKYIIPIKGEYRHMYAAREVAMDVGYDMEHVFLLDNGEQIVFTNGEVEEERIMHPVKDVYVDGSQIGIVDDDVVKERITLAEEGIIFVYGVLDMRKRCVKGSVKIASRGFSASIDDEGLNNSFAELINRMCNNALTKKVYDRAHLNDAIKEELSKNIYRFTKHRPIILPMLTELK